MRCVITLDKFEESDTTFANSLCKSTIAVVYKDDVDLLSKLPEVFEAIIQHEEIKQRKINEAK
jgi:hypothetical protein